MNKRTQGKMIITEITLQVVKDRVRRLQEVKQLILNTYTDNRLLTHLDRQKYEKERDELEWFVKLHAHRLLDQLDEAEKVLGEIVIETHWAMNDALVREGIPESVRAILKQGLVKLNQLYSAYTEEK